MKPEINFETDIDAIKFILDNMHQTVENEMFALKLLNDHYREALLWILAEPHGCPFCDSGKLRDPDKWHDDRCGFAKAQDLIGGI